MRFEFFKIHYENIPERFHKFLLKIDAATPLERRKSVQFLFFDAMDAKADSVGFAVYDFVGTDDGLQLALPRMSEWIAGIYATDWKFERGFFQKND